MGSTAIGIKTPEGVVLAVEKRVTSSLIIPTTIEKIVEIDTHIGILSPIKTSLKLKQLNLFTTLACAMSGLIADSKTLIDKARVEAQVDIL